jgi:hypothetical protein
MKVFKSTQYQSVAAGMHRPLDAHYYSVVDEPQLSKYLVSPW